VKPESRTSLYPEFDPAEVIALTMIDGFGAASVRTHLERIRTTGHPIDAGLPPGAWAEARRKGAAAIAAAAKLGARCIIDGEVDFPLRLLQLETPPVAIWTLGDLSSLARRTISIVGTRECTSYGERVTRSFGVALARAGVCIVSGMARGIDAAAHRAALEAGGPTVAVLGTGVDVPYPTGHRALHRQIAKQGAVVSEAPPGMPAGPGCFPRRNRLIAALGEATIIVEAGVKSGALDTARWADGIGRDVGVVPGPVDSPSSAGSNGLLRDSPSHCLTSVHDALSLLHLETAGPKKLVLDDPQERLVFNHLGTPARSLDALCARTGLPASICMETVTRLELRGLIECAITGEVHRR
jgi:DNA processing protein